MKILVQHQWLSAIFLTFALLLSGCSSLRLYSETRDKQGEAAKKAWAEIDVKAVISTQRENLTALLHEQLKAQERISLASRNQRIRSMATDEKRSVKVSLIDPAETQIKQLAGSSEALEQWIAKQRHDADHRHSMEKFAREFERFGFELPSCNDLLTGKARDDLSGWITAYGNAGIFVSAALNGGKEACEVFKNSGPPLKAGSKAVPLAGLLKSEADSVAAAEKTLQESKEHSLAARNVFRAALGEYDVAVASMNVDANTRAKVQGIAKKLQSTLKLIEGVTDSFGAKFLAQEKLNSLNAFLAAVSDTPRGDNPPNDSSRAAIALILLPNVIDDAQKSLSDAKRPLLVPLVIQKNYQQLNLEAATRDIAAQETLVDLRRAKLSALTDQAKQLQGALDVVGPIGIDTKNARIVDVTKAKFTDDKRRVFEALARYLDAQGRLASEVKKVDYKIDAARQERALHLAEVNVLQWHSLIGSTVDQVVDFGTTGIKAEHLIGLLNSLTLLWIGFGVH